MSNSECQRVIYFKSIFKGSLNSYISDYDIMVVIESDSIFDVWLVIPCSFLFFIPHIWRGQ